MKEEELEELKQMKENNNLIDVAKVKNHTYPTCFRIGSKPKNRIDYILTNTTKEISKYKVIDTHMFSDHQMLEIEVQSEREIKRKEIMKRIKYDKKREKKLIKEMEEKFKILQS